MCRCFGDKGDVEDITEGECSSYLACFLLPSLAPPLVLTDGLTPTAADIISTVEFDHTGNYLATGDKGGRVVLFERNETVSLGSSNYMALHVLRHSTRN